MLFIIRRKDGSIDPYSAGTFVDPSGKSIHLRSRFFADARSHCMEKPCDRRFLSNSMEGLCAETWDSSDGKDKAATTRADRLYKPGAQLLGGAWNFQECETPRHSWRWISRNDGYDRPSTNEIE